MRIVLSFTKNYLTTKVYDATLNFGQSTHKNLRHLTFKPVCIGLLMLANLHVYVRLYLRASVCVCVCVELLLI